MYQINYILDIVDVAIKTQPLGRCLKTETRAIREEQEHKQHKQQGGNKKKTQKRNSKRKTQNYDF